MCGPIYVYLNVTSGTCPYEHQTNSRLERYTETTQHSAVEHVDVSVAALRLRGEMIPENNHVPLRNSQVRQPKLNCHEPKLDCHVD